MKKNVLIEYKNSKLYMHSNRVSKYTKQKVTEFEVKINKPTVNIKLSLKLISYDYKIVRL